jgi:hypothetical protein
MELDPLKTPPMLQFVYPVDNTVPKPTTAPAYRDGVFVVSVRFANKIARLPVDVWEESNTTGYACDELFLILANTVKGWGKDRLVLVIHWLEDENREHPNPFCPLAGGTHVGLLPDVACIACLLLPDRSFHW